jgi:hypothetical protein
MSLPCLAVTKVLSLVRLVPSPAGMTGCSTEYCVQFFIPVLYSGWRNVVNLFLSKNSFIWRPVKEFSDKFPNVDVSYADSLRIDDPEQKSYVFARYKIRSYLNDLFSGRLPLKSVVPLSLNDENAGDLPSFLGGEQESEL